MRNRAGLEWGIGRGIIEGECYDTHAYSAPTKVTLTALEKLLGTVMGAVVSITFTKALKHTDVADAIMAFAARVPADLTNRTKMRAAAKGWIEGEKREMHCRLLAQREDGRWLASDLKEPAGKDERLVDPRTISSIVLRGRAYERK